MKHLNLHCIFIAVSFGITVLSVGNVSAAQYRTYSSVLEKIVSRLSDEIPADIDKDTVIYCEKIIGTPIPVSLQFDMYGCLEHIGWHFLNDSDSSSICHNPIMHFLERISMEMLLADDMGKLLSQYKLEDLYIYVDKVLLHPQTSQICSDSVYNWLKGCNVIDIRNEGCVCYIDLVSKNGRSVSLNLKPSCELIYGMNKKERDQYMAFQLSHYGKEENIAPVAVIAPAGLHPLNDSISILDGGTYLIPEIKGDVYFRKCGEEFNVVFAESMPVESLTNILLYPMKEDNIDFNITHSTYSGTIAYTVAGNVFQNYFSKGYEKYFGVSNIEENCIDGTLFIKDKFSNIAHIAIVSSTFEDVFENGVINMVLYTNIPQQTLMKKFEYDEE